MPRGRSLGSIHFYLIFKCVYVHADFHARPSKKQPLFFLFLIVKWLLVVGLLFNCYLNLRDMVRKILMFKDQPLRYEKSSVTKIEKHVFDSFVSSVLEVKVVDRCTPRSLFNNNCLQGCSQVVIKLYSHTISWAGSPRGLNSLFVRQESPQDLSGQYNHK